MGHLFDQEIATDVTFIVGKEKKRISAHKFVLVNRSIVFNGVCKEKSEIEIPDTTADVFTKFLHFLYTDKLDLTEQSVVAVHSLAREYMVDIDQAVSAFLQTNMSTANVCNLLHESHEYADDIMIVKCIKFMCIPENAKKVLQSDSFVDLCSECVRRITQSTELDAEEGTVYAAMMKWAECECVRKGEKNTSENKRKVLGDIFFTIRFPFMKRDFFLDTVLMDSMLKDNEIVNFLKFMKNPNEKLISGFSDERRWYTGSDKPPPFGNRMLASPPPSIFIGSRKRKASNST
ncbi:BTB/POZ domain-containing protein 3-like isoform X1 [Argopecten irradians]|uniref:BTB/POZ domain-containing protein 3-like isoform X1 n=1 Tax=Argopecten irradians TaxID=31199 RepID=UPI0037213612